jgi:hypothetical protein
MEEKEIKDKLKEFAENYRTEHSTNVMDFKVSKNLAAGNGFQIYNAGTIWNKDRARVCVNLLEPVVNSVVYKFTENPFDFVPQGQFPFETDWSELKFQLGSCLRDAVIDGISYLLVYKKEEEIKYTRLNNFNVIFGECDYSDGEDVKEAVYVDKRDTGKKQTKTEMFATFENILDLKKNDIPVVTYWFKEGDGVRTVKFEGDEIVSNVFQEIKHIPIVRIYGKEVPINFKKNWRGLYYLVKDLLRTIDFEMSLVQERIATAPNHAYWIAEETLGNNLEEMSKLNDIPTAFKTYKATNPNNPGVILPPPQKNDLATNVMDLMQSYEMHKATVYEILGTVAGEEKGNETAEAVLLRRETKDTAVNDLIKNLLDSAHQLCEILFDFTGVKVNVQSDLFAKARQNEELQKIIALTQFISQNKMAYTVTPVLISKLDVDEKSKQMLIQLLSQEKEEGEDQNQMIEMLKMENQQLRADKEAQVVAAQINREAQMATKTLDAQIKQEELRLKWAELGMQQEGEKIKLAQEAEKIQNDLATEIADLQIKGFNAGASSAK